MTKLNWRLSKLPTPDEVRELVKDKIITQEEARDILFKDADEPKTDELKTEIEFLRKLVEKLANGSYSKVTEYIHSYPQQHQWYQPYVTWCSATSVGASPSITYTTSATADPYSQLQSLNGNASSNMQYVSTSNKVYALDSDSMSFEEIKTF